MTILCIQTSEKNVFGCILFKISNCNGTFIIGPSNTNICPNAKSSSAGIGCPNNVFWFNLHLFCSLSILGHKFN
jgi:hypothetical protein